MMGAGRKPMMEILFSPAFEALCGEERASTDGARAGRNWRVWELGRRPTDPTDVRIGDLVMPHDALWQRGAGVVDELVDDLGRVWAVYGQRERPHESDSKTVRCYAPWSEVWIVGRST